MHDLTGQWQMNHTDMLEPVQINNIYPMQGKTNSMPFSVVSFHMYIAGSYFVLLCHFDGGIALLHES